MLKNITQLELKIQDRLFVFQCQPDSPISHVKEALFQFTRFAGEIEDKGKEAQGKTDIENLQKEDEEKEAI